MKQHITKEQLQELSPEQMKAFSEWWWSTLDDMSKWVEKDASKELGTVIAPDASWMTIGQMIEFLIEHGYQTNDYYIDDSFSSVITFGHRMESKETIEIGWTNYCSKSEELCDALWEAVKEVLQDEKKT